MRHRWFGSLRTLSLACAVLGALGCFLADPTSALAMPPKHVAFPVDSTNLSPLLTGACGFEVTITMEGIDTATVFYYRSGRIIREVDNQPGTTITVGAPASGRSFVFPFSSVFRTDYPNGTAPSASAIVTVTGLGDDIPGVPADAGSITYGNAVVLFLNPQGVPIVDFGVPTAIDGYANDPATAIAAVCAALVA